MPNMFNIRAPTVLQIFTDADEMLERRPFVVPRALGGGRGGGGGGGQDESSDEEEEIEANDNGKKRFDSLTKPHSCYSPEMCKVFFKYST